MQHYPDNTTVDPPLLTPTSFSWAYATVVVLANLVAILAANQERSWGALGFALFFGPIANLLAAASGTALLVLKRGPNFSVDGPMVLTWLLPLGFIVVDAAVIFALPSHGC